MRAIPNRCLVVFFALALASLARPADIPTVDPTWLAKAKTELAMVLEKYDKVSRRLEETSEIRSDKAPGPAGKIPFRPQTRRERVVRLGDDVIIERVRILAGEESKPQILLECENSDYHFKLGKTGEDSSYAFLGSVLGKPKNPLINQSGGIHVAVFSYLREALGAIDNDGKHTLKGLSFDDAKGLIRIDYSRSVAPPSDTRLSLDPSRGWRVVEHRVETPSLVATEDWTYGTTVGRLDFPSGFKNLTTYKVAEAPPNMEITGKVTSVKLTDKTPYDFRLSAFGFPEPIGAPPPPKQTRWYIWILVAAGVCALLAFGFAYLRRRSQARIAAVTPPRGIP